MKILEDFTNDIFYPAIDFCLPWFITTSDEFLVFLLVWFVVCALGAGLLFTRWLKMVPFRFWNIAGALAPVMLLLSFFIFPLAVRGHDVVVVLALSSAICAPVIACVSLIRAICQKKHTGRWRPVVFLAVLLFAELWAWAGLWCATDYNFMGASC